jgi:hypothetical protein
MFKPRVFNRLGKESNTILLAGTRLELLTIDAKLYIIVRD